MPDDESQKPTISNFDRSFVNMAWRLLWSRGTLREKWLFLGDWKTLRKQAKASKLEFPFGKPKPIVRERFAQSGTANGHYFHQDLHVAHRIFENKPEKHVDIASRIDGFVAHVASFREIEVFDIRALESNHPNISFTQADLMSLDQSLTDYCDSISCLHAIEHFGLGRYGDTVDFDGHLIGLENIGRILRAGGKFYFSTPIGRQRIEFNAHRVFALRGLIDYFAPNYQLDRFSYVNDAGDLFRDPELTDADIDSNFGCRYGCGIFEMTKK